MGALRPKTVAETPAQSNERRRLDQERQREEDRARRLRIRSIQDQLGEDTLLRNQRLGTRSLLSGAGGSGFSLLPSA